VSPRAAKAAPAAKRPAKRRTPAPAAPPAATPPLFLGLQRVLALLAAPSAATRRELHALLLREALLACGCRDGSRLLGRPDNLRLEAVQGLSSEIWADDDMATQDSAVSECLFQGKAIRRPGPFGETLAVPLPGADGPLGVLWISQEADFTGQQEEAAAAAATTLGALLSSLREQSLRGQAEQRLAAIINAGAAVQKDHDLEHVLDRIIREAEALLDAEASAVFLLDGADGGLRAPVATGAAGERLRDLRLAPGEGIAGWVLKEGKPALVADAKTDPRFAVRVDKATSQSTRSVVAVPINLDGRVLGVLECINRRSGGSFQDEDLPALQALALLAGVAIENARVVEALVERGRRLDVAVARASVEANESRKRLESVLFAMEDAVLAADENGVTTLLNRAAQFLTFGLTGKDALGRPLAELFPGKLFSDGLAEVRGSLNPLTLETELGPADARHVYAVVLAPIKDLEGYLTGIVLVLRDITRFRELERMKTAFLNTVSHELRTPITSIRAFSELMTRPGADGEKTLEWARVINVESERLNRLVDDLLDVSRMESGKKLSVVRKQTALRPLFERALAMQSGSAGTHPIRLQFNDDLTLAEIDPDRIQQVVMNLLSNAVKYSPEGGAIELKVDFAPPAHLRVEVCDHGMGMKEEDRSHIFEKFYRVEGSHMSGIRGTGLGLSISKYLVEAHGGRIGVESAPGKGSTFWFELPLFSGEAGPA
jgi:PAS domain S-box-containing protein